MGLSSGSVGLGRGQSPEAAQQMPGTRGRPARGEQLQGGRGDSCLGWLLTALSVLLQLSKAGAAPRTPERGRRQTKPSVTVAPCGQ